MGDEGRSRLQKSFQQAKVMTRNISREQDAKAFSKDQNAGNETRVPISFERLQEYAGIRVEPPAVTPLKTTPPVMRHVSSH